MCLHICGVVGKRELGMLRYINIQAVASFSSLSLYRYVVVSHNITKIYVGGLLDWLCVCIFNMFGSDIH